MVGIATLIWSSLCSDTESLVKQCTVFNITAPAHLPSGTFSTTKISGTCSPDKTQLTEALNLSFPEMAGLVSIELIGLKLT